MLQDVETKLSAARTRLILDKPFLGALVLRLPVVAAEPGWCPTTATDARTFYYNPQYIEALSLEETEFVLSHEALHCALSHFARRRHRVKLRWDVACDYAVNPLLIKDGLVPPSGALLDEGFEGMTAEEIYPFIGENNADEPMDKHVYDGEQQDTDSQQASSHSQPIQEDGGGSSKREPEQPVGGAPKPPPLGEGERDSLAAQWQQRLAAAAQQALQAGKLGGDLARLVDHMLQPQLPWRMLLARYMSTIAQDDFSYMRPSRREGAAILPSLRSSQVNLVVAIDTSGSISQDEMGEFLAEVDALKGQLRARITLLACDAELADDVPWMFEPWEECRLDKTFQGGGGTRFTPVFDWVDGQDIAPDLLLYFTDAEGVFPNTEPAYPVLWLVKGKGPVPWGQRIQLN